jgi:type II secretory pathway pseudopilin PulG
MKSFKDRRELRDAITDESSINMSVEEYVLSNYDVLTLENGGKIIISQIQDDYTCLVNEGCREYMIDVNQRCFSLESNKIREAIERKAQEIINSEEKDTQEITHFLSQFKVKSADLT